MNQRIARHTRQTGFSLVELSIALVIMSIVVVGLVRWQMDQTKSTISTQVAREIRAVADAGMRYTVANDNSIKAVTGPTTPYVASLATLIAGSYLPANTQTTNYYGQTFELVVIKDAAGNLQPIIASLGGQPMDGGTVREVAQMITADGGAGGYVANSANDTPGPWVAQGNAGWQVTLSNYGLNPGAGHVVDAIFFTQQSTQTNVDLALHRVADAGSPGDNTMSTTLNMGANNITNVNTLQANAQIGAAGMSPNAGLPGGWWGGVHTWDMYAEGAIGIGSGGGLGAYITNTGEFVANGWYRTNGNTGWYSQSYGGGIYMSDPSWVRVYNDKNFYTGGQVQSGTMVANGRIDAREYLQIDGLANAGWGCWPNGVMGQAADGTGMMQCKGGVWSMLAGVVDTTQVASPTSSCGGTGQYAVASCPAGYKITGGGHWLTRWAPGGAGADAAAPEQSRPAGNAWAVYGGGGAEGNSCWAAYAVCAK
ncbi:shufflon system plasmid conjugative transfer pilus tip adhesin PilV [Rhodanobacter sp. FW106-PBR-R2A-1-13]|uniref:shufflon system plasmid conjugative transfer pilus tip adhesin PilV n=1 Tax=Rhodanobacter sp. FW106-PBR-R2A-1-13 TaxID=3454845 RepID=UPI0034E5CA9E